MTSRIASLRRALRALEGLLSELPIAPEAVEARLAEALPTDEVPGIDSEGVRAFVRRANARAAALVDARSAPAAASFPALGDILAGADRAADDEVEALLRAHLTPVAPNQSVEEGFEELCDSLEADADVRLAGEIRRALAPVKAPYDADWAGSALESLGVDQEVVRSWARPSRAPGWLWARIRRDVADARTAVRARRVPVALAAATVILSASLAVVLLHESGNGEGAGPQITFLRVDRPLSDQYASATLLQRLRDGR